MRYGRTVSEPQRPHRLILLNTSKRIAAESADSGFGREIQSHGAGGGVVQTGEQWRPRNVTNPVEGMNSLHDTQEMLVR